MPELPEVHTITQDLKKYIVGAKVDDLTVINNYSPKTKLETIQNMSIGHTIEDVKRVSKYITLHLSSNHFLKIHLRLTGRLLLRSPTYKPDKYERLILKLSKKGRDIQLRYTDKRSLGTFELEHTDEFPRFVEKFGPEPLDSALTPEKFLERLQKSNTNIKNALLNQKLIAGMGNVYVNDALWMAKINPKTKTSEINLKSAGVLLDSSRKILREGIKNRGISMSDYVDLFGKPGKQQDYFRIYRKKICPTCKTKVEFIQLNQRGTYSCPFCQPQ